MKILPRVFMFIFQSVFGLLFFVLWSLLGNCETVWTVREGALNSSWNFDISNFGYSVSEVSLAVFDWRIYKKTIRLFKYFIELSVTVLCHRVKVT